MTTRYAVGQELYWEVSRYASNRQDHGMVKITKVGRKWLELSNGYRVNAKTLIADAGEYSSPGVCYENRAARESVVAAGAAWSSLRQRMGYTAPAGVSAEAIAQATCLLGL
jgi:hypothetical protein